MRRIPVMALAPVLAFVALVSWAFASPIGAGPDDDYHLVSSWCAGPTASETCASAPDEGDGVHLVPRALVDISCFARDATESAACQDELFSDDLLDSVVATDRGNFTREYPPVYHAVTGLFTSLDIQASALAMRIFTIVLFVSMMTALYLLLPVARRSTLLIGWVITTIPLGVFILASNNPSAWAVIGVGTAWIALLGYFETTGRRRIALGALYALAVVMAAGSRGDAAVYVGFATALVLVFTFRRQKSYFIQAILPAVMGLVALAFLLASRQAGSVQGMTDMAPMSGGRGSGDLQPMNGFAQLAYNLLNVPLLWLGAFGEWGLGWLDTAMPAVVIVCAVAAFALAGFLGIGQLNPRKSIIVAATVLVLTILPVYVLQQGGHIVGEQVQPRYLLPLIVMLGGLLALGAPVIAWTRAQLLIVASVLSVAHAVALHMNIRRYLTGAGVGGLDLDASPEWWWDIPVGPMAIWATGAIAYTGLLVLLALRMPRLALDRVADYERQLA
ncbi:DUF2142 domain-containing protein [Salinibacterium sp. ZJ70]|uniref:DUF2142 domain-containing protein n=1 Tax=Salinibacterium sp. ZJ70 TaxID=2708084 RepID=UPI00141EE3C3|nr:DUF2142 domain-containing protein [Salinibacterium sp. ZJ70]